MTDPLSLSQLNGRIVGIIAADDGLRDVWVVAETGDLRVSGGHCYLELLEKDPETGRPVARMRAIIWASQYARLSAEFLSATGQRLASDMRVMVRVSVNFHPAFGLSAVISDINPEFTAGDIQLRRRMLVKRLTDEGIIDMNRTLEWSDVPARIAVISAKGAAGYGDFITHLYSNPEHFRFATSLFPAVMQGEYAPQSIIEALELIAETIDDFDCVVVIRGGGATGDLSAFDNYDLAANIAQFPLPVIVGIGHERDVTILDYVAAVRVKTPTAAAEWLIDHMSTAYDRVRDIASEIFRAATARVSGGLQQLAYYQGILPGIVQARIVREKAMLSDKLTDSIRRSVDNIVTRNADRLKATSELIEALSPQSVLRRGYSITRVEGRAVADAQSLTPGTVVVTTLASGSFVSTVK